LILAKFAADEAVRLAALAKGAAEASDHASSVGLLDSLSGPLNLQSWARFEDVAFQQAQWSYVTLKVTGAVLADTEHGLIGKGR